MKKKIWAICLTLVLALATFAISGCSLFNNVGTIEWLEEPAKEYSLNETETPSFKLKVHLTSTNEDITIKYPNGEHDSKIKIDNFTTKTVGTRTATVVYEKLTLAFSYKVTDGKFADGTGKAEDPYIVNTAGQFQNMLDQKSFNYYKLGRSIDLTGVALRMANNGQKATSAEAWVGEIDGAGYTVSGISEVKTPDGKAINKYNEIFGRVARDSEKFALKNITFDFASTGKSATMGLVTANGENGVLEFTNVKLTGYINAANSGNSNISPFVSFFGRKLPETDKQAPLKSATFTNCESELQILNAYATNYVAGFASAQFDFAANTIKFVNCKFAGLIEGSYEKGAAAFFANNYTNKALLAFTGCTVADSAKIIKTAGLGKTDAKYNCGYVCLAGVTEIDGITGKAAADLVDVSLKAVTIDKVEGTKLECHVEGIVADAYKIYAVGSMKYANGNGGAFRYVQPAVAGTIDNTGKLTHTLLKIKSDATTAAPANEDTTYGSDLIVNENGVLTYYCGTVCKSIDVTNATIVVVAYNKEGKAVAIGSYVGDKDHPVNLAA